MKINYGFCHLSIIPCRAEESDRSEMVTQLLFGETFIVLEKNNQWVKIQTADDLYSGWIDQKQFLPISQNTFKQLQQQKRSYLFDLVQLMTFNQELIPVVLGSNFTGVDNGRLQIEKYIFECDANFVNTNFKPDRRKIIETAFLYQNTPYLWGGKSPFGIDCSGFSQMVYKMNGLIIPRDASQQAKLGLTLSFIEEAEEGDLAFFDNDEGNIIHVGILLGKNKIIHASGRVRIDSIDHYGIYNIDLQKYTHNLRLLKKLF
jgi:hypothetical protein